MRIPSIVPSFILAGLLSIAPFASAALSVDQVLAGILKGQGVSAIADLDCSKVSTTDVESYGEAYFTDQIDTSSPEYTALIKGFPVDKRTEIWKGMGLQLLGCIGTVATGTMPIVPSEADMMQASGGVTLSQNSGTRVPFLSAGNMGFVATWTTLVWMFSALGFAVFMIWITSSKFRFHFRKMAEGDFDMNDKAMNILKERFARGEVTKEQFDKMRRDILN